MVPSDHLFLSLQAATVSLKLHQLLWNYRKEGEVLREGWVVFLMLEGHSRCCLQNFNCCSTPCYSLCLPVVAPRQFLALTPATLNDVQLSAMHTWSLACKQTLQSNFFGLGYFLEHDLCLDFCTQTNKLITAKNTAMEHACNWTRISTVDFLKKQFLGYLFSEPKSFWNFRQDSSAMRAIRLATEFHVNQC